MAGCGELPGGGRRPNMEEEADMAGGGGRRPNMEEEEADMAGRGEQPGGGSRRPNMDEEPNMAGCGEQTGGRRPTLDKEEADAPTLRMLLMSAARQGPENSKDPSAAPHQENPENSLRVFTKEQLSPLKAFFKKKQYPNNDEQELLAKQLSVPERRIQSWFKSRRYKMRAQNKLGPESSDDPSAAHPTEDPEYSLENVQECPRIFFNKAQSSILEVFFKKVQYPSAEEQEELANQLSASQDRIQTWFLNRRRRLRKQNKLVYQRPERLDDRSAAHLTEDPERLLRNIEEYEKSTFTEVQLNTLEALFETKQCLTLTEREQLSDQLSLPQPIIQRWFKNRIIKLKHQPVNSHPESEYQPHAESETPTEDQLDFLHKQSMDGTINVAQAQTWSYLDNFPPVQPVDSSALPQGLHSSDMVYCQNVVGPPDSCAGREVHNILPESGEELPNEYLLNLSLPNQIIEPETSVLTPESSITTDLTSYDGPSTSSAPGTFQMPITQDNFNLPETSVCTPVPSITTNLTSNDGPSTSSAPSTPPMPICPDNFNLPETSVCTPGSSITTDLTFYDDLSISPGPSTFPMPIAWYTADEGSSTVPTPLIHDETTDSD